MQLLETFVYKRHYICVDGNMEDKNQNCFVIGREKLGIYIHTYIYIYMCVCVMPNLKNACECFMEEGDLRLYNYLYV